VNLAPVAGSWRIAGSRLTFYDTDEPSRLIRGFVDPCVRETHLSGSPVLRLLDHITPRQPSPSAPIWNMYGALAPPPWKQRAETRRDGHLEPPDRESCSVPRQHTAATSDNAAATLPRQAGHPRMCAVHVPNLVERTGHALRCERPRSANAQ